MPPTINYLAVKDLRIDLRNYRTRETANEVDAVHALIALRPHYFWDLMKSLTEDGYHGSENILVLQVGKEGAGEKIVREGNRRIGAMKIIHGLLAPSHFELPEDIQELLKKLPATWKADNESVPCRVYPEAEVEAVNRLVQLTHGRGESAGRLNWEAIARSRFNRDVAGASEPGLNLLETYLKNAKKLTKVERERWGGDYPLTVLDEALQKVAACYNLASAKQVVDEMDNISGLAKALGLIVHDIGTEVLHTRDTRSPQWGTKYGLPDPKPASGGRSGSSGGPSGSSTGGTGGGANTGGSGRPGSAGGGGGATPPSRGKRKPVPLTDVRSVHRELKHFTPSGTTSSKLVNLRDEALKLKLSKTPIAFCFLFRSMFELSGRAYCSVHKIPTVDLKTKKDLSLAALLGDASKHIVANSTDSALNGQVKTAAGELGNKHSFVSVPVMNQLVHSPNVTITEAQIIAGFHKVFPLLIALNR